MGATSFPVTVQNFRLCDKVGRVDDRRLMRQRVAVDRERWSDPWCKCVGARGGGQGQERGSDERAVGQYGLTERRVIWDAFRFLMQVKLDLQGADGECVAGYDSVEAVERGLEIPLVVVLCLLGT